MKLLEQEIALFLSVEQAYSAGFLRLEGFIWLNHLISWPPSTLALLSCIFSLPLKQARLWADRLNLIYENDLLVRGEKLTDDKNK